MKNIIVLIIVFIFSKNIISQICIKQFSLEVQKNINDIFFQTNIAFIKNKHELYLGQGFGINKSLFQNHIFPRWNSSYFFSIISKKYVDFRSGIEFNYSNIEWNKNKNLFWHYFEGYLSFGLEIGKNKAFCIKYGIGMISELNNKYFNNYRNYVLSISWKFIDF